ncbi:MAG: hypothetical protein ACKO6M_08500, partial [Bacteroidota bacterium]
MTTTTRPPCTFRSVEKIPAGGALKRRLKGLLNGKPSSSYSSKADSCSASSNRGKSSVGDKSWRNSVPEEEDGKEENGEEEGEEEEGEEEGSLGLGQGLGMDKSYQEEVEEEPDEEGS